MEYAIFMCSSLMTLSLLASERSQWRPPVSATSRLVPTSSPLVADALVVDPLSPSGEEVPDMVNAPAHYTWLGDALVAVVGSDARVGDVEVLDVLLAAFGSEPLLFNAGKYLLRAGRKWDAVEDLRKAVFYLEREISRRECSAGAGAGDCVSSA